MNEDVDNRAQERVGTVLNDKWTLERLLGVGGMAAVYAARHRNGARAAVKILHGDLARHAEVRERFLREGYAANRVEHPGVVKVLDDELIGGGDDEGTAFLVMELLEGESLQDRLERGFAMGELEFLRVAESVLEVLEAAHARGVVHRDLKPENLFLLKESGEDAGKGRIKVLDFGLARLLQGQAITTYGLALGTPSFMSPEQAAGRIDEIDGRTDLFALGATGFRVRTGRRIHEAGNAVELVTKMANVAAPPIRTFAPDASQPFARVIDRALQFHREDRYESAAAMRGDVRMAIAQLEGDETATRLAVRGPPDVAALPVGSHVGETTMLVGDHEFETSSLPLELARPRSSPPSAPAKQPRGPWPEDSINIPRHRSVLPWVVLLAAAGIGGKLWLDSRKATLPGHSTPGTTSASAAAAAPAASVGLVARDGGPDAASLAQRSSTPADSVTRLPAPPSPSSSVLRAAPATHSAPGNVRRTPATRHSH